MVRRTDNKSNGQSTPLTNIADSFKFRLTFYSKPNALNEILNRLYAIGIKGNFACRPLLRSEMRDIYIDEIANLLAIPMDSILKAEHYIYDEPLNKALFPKDEVHSRLVVGNCFLLLETFGANLNDSLREPLSDLLGIVVDACKHNLITPVQLDLMLEGEEMMTDDTYRQRLRKLALDLNKETAPEFQQEQEYDTHPIPSYINIEEEELNNVSVKQFAGTLRFSNNRDRLEYRTRWKRAFESGWVEGTRSKRDHFIRNEKVWRREEILQFSTPLSNLSHEMPPEYAGWMINAIFDGFVNRLNNLKNL